MIMLFFARIGDCTAPGAVFNLTRAQQVFTIIIIGTTAKHIWLHVPAPFSHSVQFSPLTDWAVGGTQQTIQHRFSSIFFFFCRKPFWAVPAWAGMSSIWCCPSSISSADQGITHPPRCPEGWFRRGRHDVLCGQTMQVFLSSLTALSISTKILFTVWADGFCSHKIHTLTADFFRFVFVKPRWTWPASRHHYVLTEGISKNSNSTSPWIIFSDGLLYEAKDLLHEVEAYVGMPGISDVLEKKNTRWTDPLSKPLWTAVVLFIYLYWL